MSKFKGEYTEDWPEQKEAIKAAVGWRCVRCGRPHLPGKEGHKVGQILTIHHLDNDKSNNAWWNTPPLCQRCHLQIQGKVEMDRPWLYEHSDWFKPYVGGFYAKKYLNLDLSRDQVIANLEYYASLEATRLKSA
jgi:hypothetical protein